MGLPDVVYLVRDGEDNTELRYSLRSLVNFPHRRVWLAGFQPKWTTNVGRIEVRQRSTKWKNITANMAAVCAHPEVSDPFVMFNDDFFVVEPVDGVTPRHRGLLSDFISAKKRSGSEWQRRLRATADHLGPDALCYDAVHIPMMFGKNEMGSVVADADGLLLRSVYGNRFQVGGDEGADVKVKGSGDVAGPFVSTSDASFRRSKAGDRIRSMFPEPGSYEA